MSSNENTRWLVLPGNRYFLEKRLVKQIVLTFLIVVVLEVTYLLYRNGHVLSTEFLLDIYLTLSVVLISGAVWHLNSFGTVLKSPHLGMMTGMTLGMQTGMMVGTILGASEGFFVGALVTMIVATTLGAIGGMSSGIGGVLEGLMAGLMGSTMGAMMGAMLLDDLFWFMPPFMIVNFVIVFGLMFMVSKEAVENKEVQYTPPPGFLSFFLFNLLALALLTIAVDLIPGSTLMDNEGMSH